MNVIPPADLGAYLAQADTDARAEALVGRVDLAGTDLTGAVLDDVVLRSATLDGVCLDRASACRADLSGISLVRVRANEFDARDALLEDAQLADAVLRFADLRGALLDGACIQRADLWGAKLDAAEAPGVDLGDAVLREATLRGADLSGARLNGASLQKADFAGANLSRADLTGADLLGASLAGADLTNARLVRLDLAGCDLRHARLADAWLERTRFRLDQLGGAVGEEVAGEWEAARRAYLGLEGNFRGLGDPDAASWCYKRARRMAKREARHLTAEAVRTRAPRAALRHAGAWLADSFAEWLCDYGESLPRVVRAYVVALLGFSFYYRVTDSLLRAVPGPHGGSLVPATGWLDIVGFSFLTMCTSTTPDTGIKPANHLVAYIGSVQYIVGVLLIGLFGFVLGNRIRR